MLHIDPLAPCTPRMPQHPLGGLAQLAASIALHLIVVAIAASIGITLPPAGNRRSETIKDQQPDILHLVFLAPERQAAGSGGGGGGNQQPGPIRRAQGVGTDAVTLRVRKQPLPPPAVTTETAAVLDEIPQLPSVVLDAKPLASGLLDQIGLPTGGVTSGTSQGSGSGGGVGTGSGTGIGSGQGPGLGPGSGGGTGGGVYRPGSTVSAPRLITEVKPKYTSQALLNRIQGSVVLEAIITSDGRAMDIRVVRSLDAAGLDHEAVAAVSQWRFDPGRLGTTPVNVLVTIVVDFFIR